MAHMEKRTLSAEFEALGPAPARGIAATVNDTQVKLVRTETGADWDRHPHDEMVIMLGGMLTVEASDGTRETLMPGETLLVPANLEHKATPEGGEARFLLIEPKD